MNILHMKINVEIVFSLSNAQYHAFPIIYHSLPDYGFNSNKYIKCDYPAIIECTDANGAKHTDHAKLVNLTVVCYIW